MLYNLYAERDGRQVLFSPVPVTLAKAAREVEINEVAGTWPEGHDAVARPVTRGGAPMPQCQSYYYADGWEPLD